MRSTKHGGDILTLDQPGEVRNRCLARSDQHKKFAGSMVDVVMLILEQFHKNLEQLGPRYAHMSKSLCSSNADCWRIVGDKPSNRENLPLGILAELRKDLQGGAPHIGIPGRQCDQYRGYTFGSHVAKGACRFVTHPGIGVAEDLDEPVDGGKCVGSDPGECRCRPGALVRRFAIERLDERPDRLRPDLAKCVCRPKANLGIFVLKLINEARDCCLSVWAELSDGRQSVGDNLFVLVIERFDQR